jgi:hypothetical protein
VAAIAVRLAVRPPLIAVAAISLAALAAIAAFAQTPSPVTLSGLFEQGHADLKTTQQLKDAIKKAPRECYPPRVKFTIVTSGGDDRQIIVPGPFDSFDRRAVELLAKARQEALEQALPSLGLEPGQFKVDSVKFGVDQVLVSYDKFNQDDMDPPTLKVTSTPREGTKVEAGDQIKVTITASKRYDDGYKSWPGNGVLNLQLIADDGRLVDSKYYGLPPPCERRTLEATYTVPRNPPRIVHLTALAEDAVGRLSLWVGEFYTVEVWHGTDENSYDASSNNGVEDVRSRYHELVTFDLYETSKGKLEGQAHATWTSSQEVTSGKCAGMKTTQDPKTVTWDAQLTGTVQHWPDGSTRFEFHATPDRGPSYKEISTPGGECTLGGTQEANQNSWDGFTFSLKQGEDHYDFPYDAPLGAGLTGQHHQELHIKSSGK